MATYYMVKATCPYCNAVRHFVSVNEIKRMVCDDCIDERNEIAEMILSVEIEEADH